MASFQINCPNCGTAIMMQEEWLGMEMECPSCHNEFTVSGNNPAEMQQMLPGRPAMPPQQGMMAPQGMGMPQPNYYPPPAPGGRFCTNCGCPVAYQAVLCVRCGCQPNQGRHFCASCGSPVSPGQVVCIRCGMSLNNPPGVGSAEHKDKIVAGLLAIFLGALGIHMFYLGNSGSGVTRLLITLIGGLFFGIGVFVMSLIAFIEGIMYFAMDDAAFQEKYVINKEGWF